MRLDLVSDNATRERTEVHRDAIIQALKNATPQQIDAWLDANVNNISDARRVLKALAKIVLLQLQGKL